MGKVQANPPTGFIYFISLSDPDWSEGDPEGRGYMKIGYTTDLNIRLRTGSPFELFEEAVFPGSKQDEKFLHKHLKKHHARREWFYHTDELDDFLLDLLDARIALQLSKNDADYDPPFRECLEFPDAESFVNLYIAQTSKMMADQFDAEFEKRR